MFLKQDELFQWKCYAISCLISLDIYTGLNMKISKFCGKLPTLKHFQNFKISLVFFLNDRNNVLVV